MKKFKLAILVVLIIFLISSLGSIMLFADSPLTFTFSNLNGKKTVHSDSFNDARITYNSKYGAVSIIYINRNATVTAAELLACENTLVFSSVDNMKTLSIATEKAAVSTMPYFKFTNLNLQVDDGLLLKRIYLENCILDNINVAAEISIKTDSTIIINENTVYNKKITVSNGASLTFEIAENATLSAQNITADSGSIHISGGCLKADAVPLISNISDIVLPEGFSYTKSDGNFIIAKNSAPDDSQAEPEDSSAPDDSRAEPEDSSAPDNSQAEPENSSAPDDSKAEPEDSSAPDDSKAEPEDSSAPDDSRAEPEDSSAPDDSQAEPEDSSTPDDSQAEPENSSAPDDSKAEPEDSSAPDDSQAKPEDSSAPDDSKNPNETGSLIINSDSDKYIDNNHSALVEDFAVDSVPLVAENPETGELSHLPLSIPFICGLLLLIKLPKKSVDD